MLDKSVLNILKNKLILNNTTYILCEKLFCSDHKLVSQHVAALIDKFLHIICIME